MLWSGKYFIIFTQIFKFLSLLLRLPHCQKTSHSGDTVSLKITSLEVGRVGGIIHYYLFNYIFSRSNDIMSNGFYLFTGYLNDWDDLEKFTEKFSVIAKTACQPQSKDSCRNLWYSLTGSREHRNIYSVPLPFHIKAVRFDDNPEIKFLAYILSKNEYVTGSENIENKSGAVISASATLLLQIK